MKQQGVYLYLLNKLCNQFKKGYKEKEDIFLFIKTFKPLTDSKAFIQTLNH
jgi:hypothetical protein